MTIKDPYEGQPDVTISAADYARLAIDNPVRCVGGYFVDDGFVCGCGSQQPTGPWGYCCKAKVYGPQAGPKNELPNQGRGWKQETYQQYERG